MALQPIMDFKTIVKRSQNYHTGMCPGLGEWWLHKGPKLSDL